MDNQSIIYIGGIPRSGGTLVKNLLDGISGIIGIPIEIPIRNESLINNKLFMTYDPDEILKLILKSQFLHSSLSGQGLKRVGVYKFNFNSFQQKI